MTYEKDNLQILMLKKRDDFHSVITILTAEIMGLEAPMRETEKTNLLEKLVQSFQCSSQDAFQIQPLLKCVDSFFCAVFEKSTELSAEASTGDLRWNELIQTLCQLLGDALYALSQDEESIGAVCDAILLLCRVLCNINPPSESQGLAKILNAFESTMLQCYMDKHYIKPLEISGDLAVLALTRQKEIAPIHSFVQTSLARIGQDAASHPDVVELLWTSLRKVQQSQLKCVNLNSLGTRYLRVHQKVLDY
jgi:hypothetical protein